MNSYIIFMFYLYSLFIHIQISVPASTSNENDANIKENQLCQWEPYVSRSKQACVDRCASVKGLIHPITKALNCFHISKTAEPIASRNQSVSFGTYTCQCGATMLSNVYNCEPRKSTNTSNIKECAELCHKLTAYISKRKKVEVIYCEEATNIEVVDLGSLISMNVHITKINTKKCSYNCSCGIGFGKMRLTYKSKNSKPKTTKRTKIEQEKEYKRRLNQTCPLTEYKFSSRENRRCSDRCKRLRGYLGSNNNNEIICFHRHDDAVDISKAKEHCKCGLHIKKTSNRRDCIPNKEYRKIFDKEKCKMKCSKYTVLRLVNDARRELKIVKCFKDFDSTKVIASMHWLMRKDVLEDGKPVYTCTCGIKSPTNTPYDVNKSDENINEKSISNEILLKENECAAIKAFDLNEKYPPSNMTKAIEIEINSQEFQKDLLKGSEVHLQPVGDIDFPNSIFPHEMEIGEPSTKISKLLLPDLNIPYEISTQETNYSTIACDFEIPFQSQNKKRKV